MGGFECAYLWGVEMKYEITKGSAKDFEGAPEWARFKTILWGDFFFVEDHKEGALALHIRNNTKAHAGAEFTKQSRLTIIAERRPITERELKPIYGDGIHDDTEALQQRIDMGIDVSNIIGEQGKLFNISRPLQFKPITEPVWDGEGLPPVGVECEFTSSSSGDVWHAGVVRYLSEHTIVIEFTDMVNGKAESISHPRTMKFRPPRSPEDVARDEEIVLLTDVICGKMPDVGVATAAMFAGRVYDAGYRRTNPHADEVQACEHKSTRPSAGGCICTDCGWRSW